MPRPSKYSPELRERAVRMVFDHAHEHPSQWATMRSVAEKVMCSNRREPYGRIHDDSEGANLFGQASAGFI